MRPYFWHDRNSTAWEDIYTGATLLTILQAILSRVSGRVFAAGSIEDNTGLNWAWPTGSLVMDASNISNRVASNPSLMQVQIYLDRMTGQENKEPFAPFVFHGKNTHTFHPPVIMPDG